MKSEYLSKPIKPILDSISWDLVYTELLKTQGTKPTEKLWEEVTNLILLALDVWVTRDLQEFDNVKVEQKYKNDKIIIDLEATTKGTLAPFDKYPPNTSVLIDWKTTFDIVDSEKWKNKCFYSWQWKTYVVERPEAKIFIYRGVSRSLWEPKAYGEYSRLKEVIIEIPPGLDIIVQNQYNGVKSQIESLKTFSIWPTNPGSATCWAWSTPCPELQDCLNFTMVEKPVAYNEELSYSSMSRFLMCPERFRKQVLRRTGVIDTDPDSSDFTIVGQMFHAGIAEIYRQLWKGKRENF